MDPKACLETARDAIADRDFKSAREHTDNYLNWRKGGGFEPEGGDALWSKLRAEYRALMGHRKHV